MKNPTDSPVSRRGVMKGIGGLTALSMSNATVARAEEVLENPLPTDPHTRDTYRAIVDAVVPRTPELEDELGPEHVPGGLDIELEKFIIWDFNHFQEIRLETLKTPLTGGLLSSSNEAMSLDLFEIGLDTVGAVSDLDALNQLLDINLFNSLSDLGVIEELLDFGAVDKLDITLADDVPSNASGPATFDLLIETGNETSHKVLKNYPYASVFALTFDIVAAEFIALGKNHDPLSPIDEQFAGGGTFVRLSREDRLRCLWTIVQQGTIDRLDVLLSPLLPVVGILKYVVMAVNGLHGFGYYTEWSGYGETKTETPSERELITPAGEVQSRKQTGYPGPASGYAADWEHVLPNGFKDPTVGNLNLPNNLMGDDVVESGGGGA
ncbi:hypothetical protein [Halocatena marina]|uniref:Uncharacterized protein n=1 Tax=Halocatena marina TaxID=2934937 RepID=A0ABD5YS05_9EURY|nr:hypothetical protein [Halocatena marina]